MATFIALVHMQTPLLTTVNPVCSICMYHMHDSFGKRTELLMHELADATSGALQMSSGILDTMSGMDSKMQGKSLS